MATTKITELNAANTIANTDLLLVVVDPAGSPITKKITANNLVNSLSGAILRQLSYANSSANGTIKVGNNLSINATGHLSVNSSISINTASLSNTISVGNSTVNTVISYNSITFPDTSVQNTAWTGAYTAANSSNWASPAPTTIASAIDRLAAVIKTLNGGNGA